MRWDGAQAAERSFATGLDLKTPMRRSQSEERAEFMIVAMGANIWIKLESHIGGGDRASLRQGVVETMSRMTREALSWGLSQYTRTQHRHPSDLLNEVTKFNLATRISARREQRRVLAIRDHRLVFLRGYQIQI